MDEQENIIQPGPKKNKTAKILKEIAEWILCFIIAYILYLFINYFIGTISGVKQVSMTPTAREGEKLVIQRTTVFKKEIKHGDIITFEAPSDTLSLEPKNESDDNIADYEAYNGFSKFLYNFVGIGKISYIKRVVGTAGDRIKITDKGEVFRNDIKLDEPYLRDGKTNINGNYTDLVVPDGCIFAMGDNRLESRDSRAFGCIPISKVDGYVITRIWPLDKMGSLDKK